MVVRWMGSSWTALEDDGGDSGAADLQVQDGVASGAAPEQLELLGIELDGLGVVAVAVDNGGQDALAAQGRDLLAGDGPMLRGQTRAGAGAHG